MNIIITGASKGIGRATAVEFLGNPSNTVLMIARDAEKLDAVVNETHAGGGTPVPLPFNLVSGDFRKLSALISARVNSVDILINNAGSLINKPFSTLTGKEVGEMVSANFTSAAEMIRCVLPMMKKGSHIVNIGSMGGFQGSAKYPGLSVYSATKGALAILTECLAEEFKEAGISVNCLALGAVQTEMLAGAFPNYRAPLMPDEMARFISDFAVSGNRFFNGKILPVALTNP